MLNLLEVFVDFRWTLWEGVIDTMYMTGMTVLISYAIGLPLGILLYTTQHEGIFENRAVNYMFSTVINMIRSVPFIILLAAMVPITRLIVGTSIGNTAAIVPLVAASAPFIARMVESTINEIDRGVIDAARSMGASRLQIICKVMVPESVPSLIRGLAIITISIISLSAMAGAIGAGGLGRIAFTYGYLRFQTDVMIVVIAVIIALVGAIQFSLNTLAGKLDHRTN